MTAEPSPTFAILYDRLFYADGSKQFSAWQKEMLQTHRIVYLETFVTQELPARGRAKFVGIKAGSYNIALLFSFSPDQSPDVVLRLPGPGLSAPALMQEKLENEVYWMQFIEEKGVFKVPHIYSWSVCGPDGIGPYILMAFVKGESLHGCMSRWGKSADANDNDNKKLSFVYEQLAEMFLQINRTAFNHIGSIAKTPGGEWAIMRRPLTMDMHQQVLGVPGFPTDSWPAGPLSSAQDYKALVVDLHRQQLNHLRNLNIPVTRGKHDYGSQEGREIDRRRAKEIARARYVARLGFAMPGSTPSLDDGKDRFTMFNPDLGPANMLVDPETGEITAVIDLEFTNAMPSTFTQDPPLWLLSMISLGTILNRGYFQWWIQAYPSVLDKFLDAMERVEAGQPPGQGPALSTLMRASWDTKRCLVNFAANNSDCLDLLSLELPEVFPRPEESDSIKEGVEAYQAHTETQITAYEKERMELARARTVSTEFP